MKKMKKCVALLLVFSMLFGTVLISDTAKAKKTKVAVKKVSVNAPYAKMAYIAKGKSVKLAAKVTVSPNKSANKKVTFKSSKKKIATVNSKGVVKAKKVGTAKITITSKMSKKKKAIVTVKIVKNPVTKVSLDKKSAALNVGGKIALKAKISAKKGASKRVYWTSSRTKVAAVSQKGVVTAKGEGIANITVMAIDGSGKKATCKVQVVKAGGANSGNQVNPVVSANITSMNIAEDDTITFALDRPCVLDKSQVVVKTKKTQTGAYQKTLLVDSLVSTDSINYTIVLNEHIESRNIVQVSIPSLDGTVKEMEQEYIISSRSYTENYVFTGVQGVSFYQYVGFREAVGYSTYIVTDLPEGLSAKHGTGQLNYIDTLRISGKPAKAGTYHSTVTATDEVGNMLTIQLTFAFGSKDEMVGATEEITVKEGEIFTFAFRDNIVGGSGHYSYALCENPYDVNVNESGILSHYAFAHAGTYTIDVLVTDEKNTDIKPVTVSLVVHVLPV